MTVSVRRWAVAQARLQSADQRLIGQQRVEVHRRLGDADALALGRDGRMKIGQRLRIIEPIDLRHEALEELQHAIGAVDEAAEQLSGIDAVSDRAPRRASSRRATHPRRAAARGM